MFDGFRNFGSEQQRGSNGASSSNGGSSSTSRGKKRTLEELFKPPLDIMFKGDLQVRYFMRFLFTLEHTNFNNHECVSLESFVFNITSTSAQLYDLS